MGRDLPDFYSDALFRVLLQRAVTERRVTMSNNGPTPSGPFPFNVLKGKFFSRGMRGFVEAVELYLKGADVDVTITISFRVYPEGGELFSVNYTLPAGAEEGWKTVTVRRPWLYDSMFVVCDSTDRTSPVHYEDYGTPYDAYAADPAAPQEFEPWNIRFWWRVVLTALTPGDVPVSGTISTVALPNVSTAGDTGVGTIPPETTITAIDLKGMGKIEAMVWMFRPFTAGAIPPTEMYLRITVDGDLFEEDVDSYKDQVNDTLNTPTPITFVKIDDVNYIYRFWILIPYEFQKSFKVEVRNAHTTEALLAGAWYWYTLRR